MIQMIPEKTITWIIGNSGAGKTTLAEAIRKSRMISDDSPYNQCIILDGDKMRKIWSDLSLSKNDRIEHNMRVARLAIMLKEQGYNVVVSVICPFKELRKQIKKMTGCKFIYIEGGAEGKEYPFDKPELY